MVLEQEIASFELASLELAGGLYANDCDLSVSCIGTMSQNASGIAGCVATVNCGATLNGLTQAVGTSVTSCSGQVITSLSLQAYGATVATSIGISGVAYLAGSYATTQQQAFGSSAALSIGQGVNQATASAIASSNVSTYGQSVNGAKVSVVSASSIGLLAQAYGEQRLSASGAVSGSLTTARVREGTQTAYGSSNTDLRVGAYASTVLIDPEGVFELADFELGMSELGGELMRYGAAHADMLYVGQALAKTDLSSVSVATSDLKPAYALQSAFVAHAAAVTDWKFSVYRDATTSINGIAVAQYVPPNARLFRVLAKSHDQGERGFELRSSARPLEVRGVKRPYEPRDTDVFLQSRSTAWS